MNDALGYCGDDLSGNLTLEDVDAAINNWTEFQSKLLKKFQEAKEKLKQEKLEQDDEDSDEE